MTTLELERIHQGEIVKDDLSEAENAQIALLQKSDEAILAKYDVASMKEQVQAKLMNKKQTKQRRVFFSYAGLAMAAALAMALFIPMFVNSNSITLVNEFSDTASDRVKGSEVNLFIYRNEDGKATKLLSGSHVNAGDVLQISYLSAKKNYGAILSIDGNGFVTEHFPENGTVASVLETGGEVPLSYSYQLDNAPKFERFFLISSNQEFALPEIKKVLSLLKNAESQIDTEELSKAVNGNVIVTEITLLK